MIEKSSFTIKVIDRNDSKGQRSASFVSFPMGTPENIDEKTVKLTMSPQNGSLKMKMTVDSGTVIEFGDSQIKGAIDYTKDSCNFAVGYLDDDTNELVILERDPHIYVMRPGASTAGKFFFE